MYSVAVLVASMGLAIVSFIWFDLPVLPMVFLGGLGLWAVGSIFRSPVRVRPRLTLLHGIRFFMWGLGTVIGTMNGISSSTAGGMNVAMTCFAVALLVTEIQAAVDASRSGSAWYPVFLGLATITVGATLIVVSPSMLPGFWGWGYVLLGVFMIVIALSGKTLRQYGLHPSRDVLGMEPYTGPR